MALPFEPTCTPLLLGSLPYRSAAQALELSRRFAGTLLAWPQLPGLSYREQSFVQSALGFPGLVIDEARGCMYVDRARAERGMERLALAHLENNIGYAALAETDAVGLAEIERQRDTLRSVRAIKGQVVGPISLAAHLVDEQQQPLIYDALLFDALTQHVRLRAMWQEARLSELVETTIICLDEPFLETIGMPFFPIDWEEARERLDQVFGGLIGCKAIFATGPIEWSQVLRTSAELIIADVYHHGSALLGAAELLGEFLARDGIVGLGLVPNDGDELREITPELLLRRAQTLIDELVHAGIPEETLLRRCVVVPTGTLGQLTPAEAEHALAVLGETAGLLRAQIG